MKKGVLRLSVAFIFAALTLFSVSAFAQEIQSITFKFDKDSQCYAVGEEATVTISVSAEDELVNSGSLVVALTNDGRDKVAESLSFDLSEENPVTINGALGFPGFLQILATAKSDDGQTSRSALAAAAFDPEKIEPGLPKPDDFDEFWAKGKEEVRALPLDLDQKKIDSLSDDNVDVFSVSFATVNDRRVFGYLCVPKKGESPYPTIVNVPGAGPGVGPEKWIAERGYVVLNMNVFPYEVPLDSKERAELYNKYNEDLGMTYYTHAADRDKYFFRAAYLGIDRAIDWLAEQDYVDVTRMGFYGTMAAPALILGGLNDHFCAILSSAPALCDHGGLERTFLRMASSCRFHQGDPSSGSVALS